MARKTFIMVIIKLDYSVIRVIKLKIRGEKDLIYCGLVLLYNNSNRGIRFTVGEIVLVNGN